MVRVLLDCDGVLSDFVGSTLEYVNFLQDPDSIPYTAADVTDWDILKCIPESLVPNIKDRWQEPGFTLGMNTYPDAHEYVRSLLERIRTTPQQNREFNIHVVTAAMVTPYWMHERLQWLYDKFGFTFKDVTFTHQKEHVRGDIFVDDKPEHVWQWKLHNPRGTAILWAHPYNESIDWARFGIRRSNDWSIVEEAIAWHTNR